METKPVNLTEEERFVVGVAVRSAIKNWNKTVEGRRFSVVASSVLEEIARVDKLESPLSTLP